MMARASQFQSNCMQLAAQLKETRDRWHSTCATNVNLQRELMALRAQVSDWQVTPADPSTLISCTVEASESGPAGAFSRDPTHYCSIRHMLRSACLPCALIYQ